MRPQTSMFFYAQRDPPPWAETGSVLVAAVDGKGIPMIKPQGAPPRVRLTKGQKSNRKKMATVAAVFTRAPLVRTPQSSGGKPFRQGPDCQPGRPACPTSGGTSAYGPVWPRVKRR